MKGEFQLNLPANREKSVIFPLIVLEAYKPYLTKFGLFCKSLSNSTNISELKGRELHIELVRSKIATIKG